MKRIIIGLIVVIVLGLLVLILANIEFVTDNNASIDFEKRIGQINIGYGANEDDNWVDFANYPEIHDFHRDVKSKYIRVWVSSQSYRESTIPPPLEGYYDFTNINKFINAVIKADALPFVVFAHAPGTFAEGHGQPPPESDEEFADYVAALVEHFKDVCNDNKYAKPCDVNEWYFEIWNEPFGSNWWDGNPPRYAEMFNTVYPRIKAIAPGAKVGGYSLVFSRASKNERLKKFLQHSEMDFISVHHYGNSLREDVSEEEKMMRVKELLYDYVIVLRSFINKYKPNSDVEIVNSEYNSDHREEYMPYLDEQYTATWYASALIWEIKSQEIGIELFYSGTSNFPDKGFGMWSKDRGGSFGLWPVYYMKKSFVKYNKPGSLILDADYNHHSIDILAVENIQGKFITLVNKLDKDNSIRLELLNIKAKELVDLKSQKKYSVLSNSVQINLEPYEVKFLQVK